MHKSIEVVAGSAPSKLHKIDEACDILGIGRSQIYKMIRAGRLRGGKLGGSSRISSIEIARFIADLPPISAADEFDAAVEAAADAVA